MNKLNIFTKRLSKLNIHLTYFANYPWIYLNEINYNKVKEKFESEHGFVVGYTPIRPNEEFQFTDITEIFKLLRKYLKN